MPLSPLPCGDVPAEIPLPKSIPSCGRRRPLRRKKLCPPQSIRPAMHPKPLQELQGPDHLVASALPEGFPPELAFRALAAYSLLRTLSYQLRLSPFTPNVFLRALLLPYPNRLLGQIHVSLLRVLLPALNMGYSFKPRGGYVGVAKKRHIDGLRWDLRAGDNLTYLDGFSWPLFYDDYVHLTADVLWSQMNDNELHVNFRNISFRSVDHMTCPESDIDEDESMEATMTAYEQDDVAEKLPSPTANPRRRGWALPTRQGTSRRGNDPAHTITPLSSSIPLSAVLEVVDSGSENIDSETDDDDDEDFEVKPRPKGKRKLLFRTNHEDKKSRSSDPAVPTPVNGSNTPDAVNHSTFPTGSNHSVATAVDDATTIPIMVSNSNSGTAMKNSTSQPQLPANPRSAYGSRVMEVFKAESPGVLIRLPLPAAANPTASSYPSKSSERYKSSAHPVPSTMPVVKRKRGRPRKQFPTLPLNLNACKPTVSKGEPPKKRPRATLPVLPTTVYPIHPRPLPTVYGATSFSSMPFRSGQLHPSNFDSSLFARSLGIPVPPHHYQPSAGNGVLHGNILNNPAPAVTQQSQPVLSNKPISLPSLLFNMPTPLPMPSAKPHEISFDIAETIQNYMKAERGDVRPAEGMSSISVSLVKSSTHSERESIDLHIESPSDETLTPSADNEQRNDYEAHASIATQDGADIESSSTHLTVNSPVEAEMLKSMDGVSSCPTQPQITFHSAEHVNHNQAMSDTTVSESAILTTADNKPDENSSDNILICVNATGKVSESKKSTSDLTLGTPTITQQDVTSVVDDAANSSNDGNLEATDSKARSDHWPQFHPIERLRSGVPYHRLQLEEKMHMLEFLLDEILTVDIIAAEFTRRHAFTESCSFPYDSLPTQEELETLENDDECGVCGLEGELLCCDGCISSYHRRCICMNPGSQLPEGKWLCPECRIVDPAKLGSLRGGRKASLDWFTINQLRSAARCKESMGRESNESASVPLSITNVDGCQSTPLNASQPLSSSSPNHDKLPSNPQEIATVDQPVTATDPESSIDTGQAEFSRSNLSTHCAERERDTELSQIGNCGIDWKRDDMFLVVHGFVFRKPQREEEEITSLDNLQEEACIPLAQRQLSTELHKIGSSVTSEWPLFQIPLSPSKIWGVSIPQREVGFERFFVSPDTYDPSSYSSFYRIAPFSSFMLTGADSMPTSMCVLADYESECSTSDTRSFSMTLSRDMSVDNGLIKVLQDSTALFNPYHMISMYLIKLENMLKKACLLHEFWGMRKGFWPETVVKCRSIPRLAKLLLRLVDAAHLRVFYDEWHSSPGSITNKCHTDNISTASHDSRNYHPLPPDWSPGGELLKRKWERSLNSNVLSLLSVESNRLDNILEGVKYNHSLGRTKRKNGTTHKNVRHESQKIEVSSEVRDSVSAQQPHQHPISIERQVDVLGMELPTKRLQTDELAQLAQSIQHQSRTMIAPVKQAETLSDPTAGMEQSASTPESLSPYRMSDTPPNILAVTDDANIEPEEQEHAVNEENNSTMNAVETSAGDSGKHEKSKKSSQATKRTRRSGRLQHRTDFSDVIGSLVSGTGDMVESKSNEDKIIALKGQDCTGNIMSVMIEEQRKAKLVKLEKLITNPSGKESHWPAAGRKLFDPDGYLPPTEMKRLARNAGTVVAPFVTYTSSFEVGQPATCHIWRKKILLCNSFEELVTHIRVLDSFINKSTLHTCETFARRSPASKGGVQKVIRCTQRDLETGIVHHFVIHKGKHRGCWISSDSVELSSLLLDRTNCLDALMKRQEERNAKATKDLLQRQAEEARKIVEGRKKLESNSLVANSVPPSVASVSQGPQPASAVLKPFPSVSNSIKTTSGDMTTSTRTPSTDIVTSTRATSTDSANSTRLAPLGMVTSARKPPTDMATSTRTTSMDMATSMRTSTDMASSMRAASTGTATSTLTTNGSLQNDKMVAKQLELARCRSEIQMALLQHQLDTGQILLECARLRMLQVSEQELTKIRAKTSIRMEKIYSVLRRHGAPSDNGAMIRSQMLQAEMAAAELFKKQRSPDMHADSNSSHGSVANSFTESHVPPRRQQVSAATGENNYGGLVVARNDPSVSQGMFRSQQFSESTMAGHQQGRPTEQNHWVWQQPARAAPVHMNQQQMDMIQRSGPHQEQFGMASSMDMNQVRSFKEQMFTEPPSFRTQSNGNGRHQPSTNGMQASHRDRQLFGMQMGMPVEQGRPQAQLNRLPMGGTMHNVMSQRNSSLMQPPGFSMNNEQGSYSNSGQMHSISQESFGHRGAYSVGQQPLVSQSRPRSQFPNPNQPVARDQTLDIYHGIAAPQELPSQYGTLDLEPRPLEEMKQGQKRWM